MKAGVVTTLFWESTFTSCRLLRKLNDHLPDIHEHINTDQWCSLQTREHTCFLYSLNNTNFYFCFIYIYEESLLWVLTVVSTGVHVFKILAFHSPAKGYNLEWYYELKEIALLHHSGVKIWHLFLNLTWPPWSWFNMNFYIWHDFKIWHLLWDLICTTCNMTF